MRTNSTSQKLFCALLDKAQFMKDVFFFESLLNIYIAQLYISKSTWTFTRALKLDRWVPHCA